MNNKYLTYINNEIKDEDSYKRYRKNYNKLDEPYDFDVEVKDVFLDGEPLDGKYLERMIESL